MNLEKAKDKTEYNVNLQECRIKIGGKTEKFVPNINASKWNDEAWLNINHPDVVQSEKEEFGDDKIKLKIGKKTHRYYVKDGKLEYEIEFESRPDKNTIALDLDFPDGLMFWYQSELTQEEIDGRCERPENVVGSYAVYWKKRNNKYKTGKFCHIYRPKLIDADGNWIWVDIEVKNKKLVFYFDEIWLDNAKYPVVLDPVLGYDTAGASSRGNNTTINRGTPSRTDGIDGVIQTWHCAIAQIGASANVKLAVYDCDQADGNPSSKSLIEQVEYEVAVSDDESTPASGTKSVIATTWYLLCINMENADTYIKYDNAGGEKPYWYKGSIVYANQYPNPADTGWASSELSLYSIWVDYEAAGGEEFIRTIADNVEITDALSKSATFIRNIVDTVNISDVLTAVRLKFRKIIDVIGITDILKVTTTIAKKIDSFGVSNIIQSVRYKKSKISKVEEDMRPRINEIRGIKNE